MTFNQPVTSGAVAAANTDGGDARPCPRFRRPGAEGDLTAATPNLRALFHGRGRRIAALAFVLSALAVAGCGDDAGTRDSEEAAAPPTTDSGRLEHIHGLGAHPRTGTLYVATHYGLFQAQSGSRELRRIGDSTQDIMGFSVASADRFIGSGHPDPSQDLPPNLGVIESRDGGRTWDSISLMGEADFHVLRSAGDRVYGFDATNARLMTSTDGGRTWDERTPPGPLFDLAIDPSQDERIVASTDRGVFVSRDAGKGWRPLQPDAVGLLAWPAPGRLLLADPTGQVLRSADGGRTSEPLGQIGGEPVAFTAAEDALYAALGDGTVKHSTDAGATWSVRAAP